MKASTHHVERAKKHASHESHHAVFTEAHTTVHDQKANATAVSAADASALIALLGLTSDEVKAMLGSKHVTPEQASEALHVNPQAIARAFSSEVTSAITSAGAALSLTMPPAAITSAAAHVGIAASAAAKLRVLATGIEYGVRVEATSLDGAAREINRQIEARAADDALAENLAPIAAYHHVRYPGGHHHAATAPTKPAT